MVDSFSEKVWQALLWRFDGLTNDHELFDRLMDILVDESCNQTEQLFEDSERVIEKPKLRLINGGKHEHCNANR